MATLNGVTFGILKKSTTVIHDNIVIDIPGSDTVVQEDMGYSTAPMQMIGHVKNESEYDDFKEQFYSGGELTLIIDADSGKQYTVFAMRNLTDLDGQMVFPLTDIVFQADFYMKNPYKESVLETTRSKTITTNNQEWSADDVLGDIKTAGNVDAVPDIQVTAGFIDTGITQDSTDAHYNISNSAAAVTISNAVYTDNTLINTTGHGSKGQTVDCRKAGMGIIDSIQIDVKAVTIPGDIRCDVKDKIGGNILATKTLTISAIGLTTFTLTTPIAAMCGDLTCANSLDSRMHFNFTAIGSADISIAMDIGGSYPDGDITRDDIIISGDDLYFVVAGQSIKEVRQTFEVVNKCQLSRGLLLKLCKYQYAGTNPVTVIIKEGANTLGTGTAVLSGTTFADVTFDIVPATPGDLILIPSTTYTISITPPSDSWNTTNILIDTKKSDVYADGAVTLVEDGGTTRAQTHDLYFVLYAYGSNEDVQIYNTADTTVKCNVSNEMLSTAIHKINVDGTGTIDFDDNFTTDKWKYTAHDWSGITHDETDDELDIADDGYIYYLKDTKYPVTGIPTLTAQINITAGTPTIQISTDASTWYDIDTAIVDDVLTVYALDNDANLSLPGKTVFYWRIDCVKAAAATCSVKSFALDINIHTIYAKNPKIAKGASANTFRIDQAADSGLACEVSLYYRGRWWS